MDVHAAKPRDPVAEDIVGKNRAISRHADRVGGGLANRSQLVLADPLSLEHGNAQLKCAFLDR